MAATTDVRRLFPKAPLNSYPLFGRAEPWAAS